MTALTETIGAAGAAGMTAAAAHAAPGRRADLLALTPDALVALANRGLYKRAAKEVEAGAGPAVAVEADTVRGTFTDGVATALPPGGLDAAVCGCGAAGICRHVLAVVLAYQASQGSESAAVSPGAQATASADDPGAATAAVADPVADWSPGAFSDEELAALLGPRAFASARLRLGRGFLARVHRPTPAEPVARVDLPASTVRFLVPGDLGYARSDARDDAESVALAVWAWRRAEEAGFPDTHLGVGGASAGAGNDPLVPAGEVAAQILLTGVAQLGPGFAQHVAQARRRLDEAGLRWPLLALDELADQLAAHTERAARHQRGRVAELLAELAARSRAAASPGGEPRSRVLGTEEAAEVALRRIRLTGLGCRVAALGEERTVRIFLADPAGGTVLTVNQRWPSEPESVTGWALGARRLAGSTVAALAGGNIVTETALRSADRRLRLGINRIAKTTVSRSAGAWSDLPPTLLVRDLGALSAELDRLPPRLIRPRIEAEDLKVIEVQSVDQAVYHPGDQRLEAVVTAPGGGSATVVAEHRRAAPAALDAIADALARGPRFIAATVRRGRGGLLLTPVAFSVDDGVVIPDLVPGDGTSALPAAGASVPDPLSAAVDRALDLLADIAHRGARHLPPSFPDRIEAAARDLAAAGLERCATSLRAVAAALGPDPGAAAVAAWQDAHIRLLTTAEAR